VLDSVGSLLRAWRMRQGLTQAAVAALLHATTKTVSNWETGSRRIPVDALAQLDAAYDAGGCLVDLARAVGKAEASAAPGGMPFLGPRRSWSHVFDAPASPIWIWVRPDDHAGGLGGRVVSGPLGVRLPDGIGPGGMFLTLASWHSTWPFHVLLDRPGWVEYGRGVPPAWLAELASSATYLSLAEFVHAPDRQVEFFVRMVRERDQGDPATLADRLRDLAGPANWDPAANSWLAATASRGARAEHAAIEALPPTTADERRVAHRRLRTALGFSRAEAAAAVTTLLGPGARPVTEDQIYHYEDGRSSRIRHLPALLDRVYGADGWTCLEPVPVRRTGPDQLTVDFPAFWVGPVQVTAEPVGQAAAAGTITLAMGHWENRGGLRLEPSREQSFRFCRHPDAPPVRLSVPSGWTIRVQMGHDPHAVVASNDWSPAEAHSDEVFDLSMESLLRTVGRTRADFDEATTARFSALVSSRAGGRPAFDTRSPEQ
jgi:DNA-binding XRE family transcriptional regulator